MAEYWIAGQVIATEILVNTIIMILYEKDHIWFLSLKLSEEDHKTLYCMHYFTKSMGRASIYWIHHI